jgi:hypothetical protein
MKKILLIATGGTIASEQTGNGLAPRLHPKDLLRYVPDAANICELDTIQPFHIDSTNVSPAHWLTLTGIIEESYAKYDGLYCNAQLNSAQVQKWCQLPPEGEAMMRMIFERMKLSARAYMRMCAL